MTNSKHPHTIIRRATVTVLSGNTSARDAVRASRKSPWKANDIPSGGILVYTEKSDTDPKSTRGQQTQYERSVDLMILIALGVREDDTSAADDAVDAIARQVEILMRNNDSLGLETDADALAIGLIPSTCIPVDVVTDVDETGKMSVSWALLRYRVTVYDRMLDANTGLVNDFATAGATINLGDAQAEPEVTQDVIAIPTT